VTDNSKDDMTDTDTDAQDRQYPHLSGLVPHAAKVLAGYEVVNVRAAAGMNVGALEGVFGLLCRRGHQVAGSIVLITAIAGPGDTHAGQTGLTLAALVEEALTHEYHDHATPVPAHAPGAFLPFRMWVQVPGTDQEIHVVPAPHQNGFATLWTRPVQPDPAGDA
jgi:hypothetical protein